MRLKNTKKYTKKPAGGFWHLKKPPGKNRRPKKPPKPVSVFHHPVFDIPTSSLLYSGTVEVDNFTLVKNLFPRVGVLIDFILFNYVKNGNRI